MEKIRVEEVIVVEGKDDTAAILKAVDGITIETHGYGISEKTFRLIENAYKKKGIIIFTDPDFAGENIRKRLKEKFPEAKHAFLDRSKATKKEDIGIENAKPEDIIEALKKAHFSEAKVGTEFTQSDIDNNGFSGRSDSKERRRKAGDILGIGYANSKTFLKRLNTFAITREDFEKALKEMEQ